jgi:cyclopropane-fatty-acyl-phospholipid synthase
MNMSCFYDAWLRHERHSPVPNTFTYKIPVFVFDLAELENGRLDNLLFARRPESGARGVGRMQLPRLLSVREKDYLYARPGSLRAKLGKALAAGGQNPGLARGHVRLITSARFLGFGFNPVSFWFVFADAKDPSPAAVVAEVNNTFKEKHIYVLGDQDNPFFPLRYTAAKTFHVSPFNDMQGEYCFFFQDPREKLDICIELVRDGRPLLTASLWSEAPAWKISAASQARFFLHPHRTLTYPRILRQAARLYFRRKLPVHQKPEPRDPMTIRTPALKRTWLIRLVGFLLPALFRRTEFGTLTLVQPDESSMRFQGPSPGPDVRLNIHDYRVYKAMGLSGDIGFGEAYTRGWWSTPDLPELLRFFVLNHEQMRVSRVLHVPGPVIWIFNTLRRLGGSRNTKKGARQNIHAHYDLGDELFSTFLDPSMAYSCAYFEDQNMTLAQAQEAKYRRAVELLNLQAGDRVLEIGCGWGGFALYAAEKTGCTVQGITISENQLNYAREKARERGLDHLVSFTLTDYREVAEEFDKIVSIEMLEAVGHAYHRRFFAALDRLLAPGGQVFIQFIAIHDQRYQAYRFQGDWTRKHIFPGGLLPSLTRIMEVMRDETRFTLRWAEAIGPDYARTLAMWRENFLASADRLETMGYDQFFRRTWDYYLSYCQAGFSCRVIDDYQIVLARPEGSGPLSSGPQPPGKPDSSRAHGGGKDHAPQDIH